LTLSTARALITVECQFLEIVSPRKLVQTWRPEWDGGETTVVCPLVAENHAKFSEWSP
jgi:uncharacterized protein YndB with AHSA1/START domain